MDDRLEALECDDPFDLNQREDDVDGSLTSDMEQDGAPVMSETVANGTLAVIPARGGSKGVARKNIRLVAGKPLIAHTIATALGATSLFHRVIVSTDDVEIARIAEDCGAEVPFMRPRELSGDDVRTIPVLQHALEFVERADDVRMSFVCLLQPTDPFREVQDIRNAMTLMKQGGCDSVISVMRVDSVHPILMKRIENNQILPFCIEEVEGTPRQKYEPPAYMRNGAIYLTRRDVLMKENSIWGRVIRPYIMPPERSISIDDEIDLRLADVIMSERISGSSPTPE